MFCRATRQGLAKLLSGRGRDVTHTDNGSEDITHSPLTGPKGCTRHLVVNASHVGNLLLRQIKQFPVY